MTKRHKISLVSVLIVAIALSMIAVASAFDLPVFHHMNGDINVTADTPLTSQVATATKPQDLQATPSQETTPVNPVALPPTSAVTGSGANSGSSTGLPLPPGMLAPVPALSSDEDDVREGTPTQIRTNLDKTKPMIAFTFDDGPSATNTPRITAALDAIGGRATFFVVGNRLQAQKNKEVLKQTYASGHEIGNHSWSHPVFTKMQLPKVKAEINRTDSAIAETIGVIPKLLRPPYGAYNDEIKKASHKTIAMWSVDTEDWKHRDATYVCDTIIKSAHTRAIVLLHDIHDTSVEGFLRALPELHKQGYQFVTVSELAYYAGVNLTPGDTIEGR